MKRGFILLTSMLLGCFVVASASARVFIMTAKATTVASKATGGFQSTATKDNTLEGFNPADDIISGTTASGTNVIVVNTEALKASLEKSANTAGKSVTLADMHSCLGKSDFLCTVPIDETGFVLSEDFTEADYTVCSVDPTWLSGVNSVDTLGSKLQATWQWQKK